MKFQYKLITALSLTSATFSSIYAINKLIQYLALKNKKRDTGYLNYDWRLGNIKYIKVGSGTPLLLVHNVDSFSSSIEWEKVIANLSQKHTVYAIDLLACGISDKPNITYTNYLYVQLIIDFIKNIIGKRTDVIASSGSCSIISMTSNIDKSLFNKIVYISPENLDKGLIIPSKLAKLYMLVLNFPILGNLIYNIASSKKKILKRYNRKFLTTTFPFINEYYINSKYGFSPKSLYSSIICNYMNINSKKALKNIDNTFAIITGEYNTKALKYIEAYKEINPSIEIFTIKNSKELPHIENPKDFSNELSLIL